MKSNHIINEFSNQIEEETLTKNTFDYYERENDFSIKKKSCDPCFSNDNHIEIKHTELILNQDISTASTDLHSNLPFESLIN